MIYLKNNTETQAIYIPRQTVLGGGYIPSTKAYDKGYNDGLEDGKEQQKGKLSNLNVTANGQYEREDGWNVVNVDVPDLNGSYNEGYEQGKTDGANEQKSKLESINITENGTYNKEDGYNHIEVNVPSYEEGQADMAAKARILNVTENGVYRSKFSDPIKPTVTGVYADGTEFYNYAYLEGISYDSGFMVSEDMEVEIWWKGDVSKTDKNLFGSQVNNNYAIFKIRIPDTAYRFDGEIAMKQVTYLNAESNRWYHFKMSYADGLWVDGVKIGDFSSNISGTPYKLYINSNTPHSFNGVNGYFGMIKITTNGVENIIIPTAEGLKNITTNERLQVELNGSYTFTENLPTYGEGELYKTINVNVPDLNGSYDEGKTDGINEQKSKLETINITVNGTYNREDGYNKIIVKVPDLNGSYDEGYEQGQADIAENAIVLNVTENGVYKTKFSDPIMPTTVTGVYADGTEFYNYAELNGKVFNTNITATPTTRLELWYKGDNERVGDAWNIIIGAEKNPDYSCYQIRYYIYSNSELIFELGRNNLRYTWDENAWHHILIAKETENASSMSLWVDEVKIGDFGNRPFNPQSPFYINCIESYTDLTRNANGYFGMIKIDDVVIIPTADGFKNVNTGELLEVVKDGDYTFTKNLPTYGEGEIYKTINVNVPDLNGSYDEGKTDGVNEQKSKLESINITENGVYSKEDGYNHIEVNVPTEAVSCNLEDKWVTPSMNDRDSNGYIVVRPSEGYNGLKRTVINPQTIYNEGLEAGRAECVCPSAQEQSFGYDITAFTYKVYDWTSVNINRDNITNDCGDRPLDCLLFRNRSGECTVMTKLDNCSGTARLENGWSGDNIILSLKSNSITKFSSNSINSNQLTSIDTGFAKLEGNAITNCSALTDIKVTVLNDDLSTQFAANCFNGLPAEGTITIGKNVDVTITLTDDEITSFFRTIVGEGWTITIKQ